MRQADEEDSTLPAEEEAELLLALAAALRPTELEPAVNERLIEMALEDPLAPPSEEELIESARLRDALARGDAHEDESLLEALRAPFTVAATNEPPKSVESALSAALGSETASKQQAGRRGNVVYAAFGAGSLVLAAAAAIALFSGGFQSRAYRADTPFVTPHSTSTLFDQPFETGATTARMDRIVTARSRDLRDNRYAAWGVR